ncbi:RNA polymerase sigma factor [Phycisphaera mikurensis]|uniref:RNA polymerase ECF-type sigma factor n=1 Tax=Phycisphaera mikurensis (strain NBRC 102666 / KCTC 22515 / FYK2301M01) TaxID=1142394 RepID=I0IHA3_PHYMF|nr:sigma-70 family RNA polymerase sigma factor [Phycisphaera mikurensis]MBB6440890.1 RNA polymerase sigma-70 factor (ECF subfamily) [Phycisphaera mikurensis]BAM04641.1 RNA polymerase ECF-type sigma factor [Phycisphaera mikurensis NBRC 102666]
MLRPPADPRRDWPLLVERARTGDAAAWSAIVDGMGPRVMGLMVARTRDRELAEELTAATFAKLVEVLTDPTAKATYTESGRFEAWLLRIAMNKLRDEMRRRKKAGPGSQADDEGGDPLDRFAGDAAEACELAEVAESLAGLRAAVATLPDADREVLHLRHTAGLTFPEIAARLAQPLGTVLARAHRAHKKLARLLTAPHPLAR